MSPFTLIYIATGLGVVMIAILCLMTFTEKAPLVYARMRGYRPIGDSGIDGYNVMALTTDLQGLCLMVGVMALTLPIAVLCQATYGAVIAAIFG